MLNFIGTISSGCSYGILGYSVMAAYIFLIVGGEKDSSGESNLLLGYSEGAQGLAQLIPGIAAGFFADRWRRDSVIRIAGFLSVLAIAACAIVVLADGKPGNDIPIPGFLTCISGSTVVLGDSMPWRFLLLTAALCLWSAAMGVSNAPMQAIFADSVATGQRTEIYTALSIASTLSTGLGPLLAMGAFAVIGDKWTIPTLTLIILIGIGLYIPALITFFLYRDEETLGVESEAIVSEARGGVEALKGEDDLEEAEDEEGGAKYDKLREVGCLKASWVPGILWISDLIWCFGSGMTVKFFPIFFLSKKHGTGLPPTIVNLIFVLNPILIALGTALASQVSRWLGRVWTDIAFWCFGISNLVLLGCGYWLGWYGEGSEVTPWQTVLVVCLYLGRTFGVTSTTALRQSILFDYAPKKHRAKWSALDSISSLGWSGSAMVGGWVVKNYSYHVCFLATCCMHTTSVLLRTPLLLLVPNDGPEEGAENREPNQNPAEEARAPALPSSAYEEPLLSTTDSRPSVKS